MATRRTWQTALAIMLWAGGHGMLAHPAFAATVADVCGPDSSISCVRAIDLRLDSGLSHITIHLNRTTTFNVARRSYTGRIVVDLKNTVLGPGTYPLPQAAGVVDGIRVGQHDSFSRIVFDVSDPEAARHASVGKDARGAITISIRGPQSAAGRETGEESAIVELDAIDPSMASRHERAVALARDGQFDASLQLLSALRAEQPANVAYAGDEILILTWAGRNDLALERGNSAGQLELPLYALTALGRAARAVGQGEVAVAWYERALIVAPGDADATIGSALALTDTGRPDEASALLATVPEPQRATVDYWFAAGYGQARLGNQLVAVRNFDSALAFDPNHFDSLRGKALALRAMLLPAQALELERRHPGTLTSDEVAHLEADELALAVRYSTETVYPQDRRYAGVDAALDSIDDHLTSPGPESARQRVRMDRIVALTARRRMAEAISEYESLSAQGLAIPAYVHAAAGYAYTYERRPADGLLALETAADLAPDDLEIQMDLFYAYVENERHDDAIRLGDRLTESLPEINRLAGSRIGRPNPNRLRAEIMASLGRAYADQLSDSQDRLESIVYQAPHNTDARSELASVYRWRGWYDRAADEYSQVLAVEPELLNARTGLAHAQLDRQEYRSAHESVEQLAASYNDDTLVRNLTRRWNLHNRSELIVDAGRGESSGDTFGAESYELQAWWYTAPIAYRFRAFARSFDSWGEFEEGEIARRRIAAGLEYRSGPWLASAETSVSRDGFDNGGFALNLARRISDRWEASARLELNSYDTPLRAHRVDTKSNLVAGLVTYRPNELALLSFETGFQDFEDTNQRWWSRFYGRWRAFNGSRLKIDATGAVAMSTNTLDSAPYFNPADDSQALVGLDAQWRIFRRYEHEFLFRASIDAGSYRQDGFGSGGIWSGELEMSWAPSAALEFSLGYRRSRMIYDGNEEYQSWIFSGLNGRF